MVKKYSPNNPPEAIAFPTTPVEIPKVPKIAQVYFGGPKDGERVMRYGPTTLPPEEEYAVIAVDNGAKLPYRRGFAIYKYKLREIDPNSLAYIYDSQGCVEEIWQ